MSWTDELYRVYEQQSDSKVRESRHERSDKNILLPISHSTANVQIEVTLREDGSFDTARALTKEEGLNTIIPVTEDSGARTSGICAMPFADKLIYLAGDYYQYTEKDNSEYFGAYISQLGKWHSSQYTHPSVDAVYTYLSQQTIIHDLINCHVLQINPETGKLTDNFKIAGIDQADTFVRFIVHSTDRETQTWEDTTLYNSFIAWNSSEMGNEQLCYATGRILPVTYKHPNKIRNTGDKAKLISTNDDSGFTYRGRFTDKYEAISVSYDFSQKMHNALRWLIQRQGFAEEDIIPASFTPKERKELEKKQREKRIKRSLQFDTLQLVVWASSLQYEPDIMGTPIDPDDDEYDPDWEQDWNIPDTQPIYRDRLKEYMRKRQEIEAKLKIAPDTKVMIMGVDAATTGRLSIALYDELEHSRLMENMADWHSETATLRYFSKQRKSLFCSFSVRDIINCAYGTENEAGWLSCKPEIMKDNVLRLIPCITQGRKLPADIMQSLVHKSSAPLSYEQVYNHRKVIDAASGMIRKYNLDRKKGIICMAYDPNETDRSYLYGCLLAIADAAEYASYDEADKKNRITNAKRYWNMFSKRPYITWKTIREQLGVYLNKLGSARIRYEKMLDEIMMKFDLKAFSDNKPLDPAYLLGYQHYHAEIYKKKEEE